MKYHQQYYQKNKEKLKAYQRKYYHTNKQKILIKYKEKKLTSYFNALDNFSKDIKSDKNELKINLTGIQIDFSKYKKFEDEDEDIKSARYLTYTKKEDVASIICDVFMI